ncbi:hypothetical protein, partial [Motilimonas sp. KMU-193]|uniref:hypothetical protein n=1 Tax=Motilimonas sp. KMU-193 TaxID=3388668 RepID=UPI00396B218A
MKLRTMSAVLAFSLTLAACGKESVGGDKSVNSEAEAPTAEHPQEVFWSKKERYTRERKLVFNYDELIKKKYLSTSNKFVDITYTVNDSILYIKYDDSSLTDAYNIEIVNNKCFMLSRSEQSDIY